MAANNKAGRHHIVHVREDGNKCKKCIFRVPNVLRRQNPQAYTPDVVSIGPFHHRKPEGGDRSKEEGAFNKDIDFQRIEGVKQNYLNEILKGLNIPTLEELTLKVTKLPDLIGEVGFDQCARDFYEKEALGNIPPKEFTEMMILDGCFLVQLFRKFNHPNLRAFDDLVFNMDCMFYFLCHDILLLENQLPWFVIHTLYNLTHNLYPNEAFLSSLILEAFSTLPSLKKSCSNYKSHIHRDKNHHDSDSGYLHILDLLRSSIVVPLRTKEDRDHSKHIAENNVKGAIFDPDQHQIRTATSLSKADIKFQMVEMESIMDIRFEKGRYIRNGILMIPQLNIGMASETLFRNFIAIEQCYHGYLNEITSYAILMDNLISSNEDMELLCKKKVIGNWMSDEDGCRFFSNLYKDIPHNKFYYVKLCKEVNDCYSLKWYEWMVLLKSEKFSNPWRILAFGVAIIILILTAWSQTNNIRVNMHKK